MILLLLKTLYCSTKKVCNDDKYMYNNFLAENAIDVALPFIFSV
jgi:hypothetical protein